jgi:VIT1/CCC1 family predicted Fe2+/Mn2+ transporter
MQEVATLTTMVSAMWITLAILAGGLARTRNRSPWYWFLLTVFLGPIAAFLLVVWPPLPAPVTNASMPGR